jgi:hypothetical protein
MSLLCLLENYKSRIQRLVAPSREVLISATSGNLRVDVSDICTSGEVKSKTINCGFGGTNIHL